jgi:hypothetical protein
MGSSISVSSVHSWLAVSASRLNCLASLRRLTAKTSVWVGRSSRNNRTCGGMFGSSMNRSMIHMVVGLPARRNRSPGRTGVLSMFIIRGSIFSACGPVSSMPAVFSTRLVETWLLKADAHPQKKARGKVATVRPGFAAPRKGATEPKIIPKLDRAIMHRFRLGRPASQPGNAIVCRGNHNALAPHDRCLLRKSGC